jgi:hypothetical protein
MAIGIRLWKLKKTDGIYLLPLAFLSAEGTNQRFRGPKLENYLQLRRTKSEVRKPQFPLPCALRQHQVTSPQLTRIQSSKHFE